MSKHWRPNSIVRPDFRRRLRRRRPRWQPAALLAGAALVGAAVGVGQALLTGRPDAAADPAIEWTSVQAVPKREPAAEDDAWERRAVETVEAEPAVDRRASATRASFGFCHTGGGTNCVVDGDTLWLGGQRVRVADIDAPETHEPRRAEEAALGNRATQRLRQLLNGGVISVQPIDRDEDRYGRKLRVVLVDGRSVGDTLVGEGLARFYEGGRRPWC
jgi:hypothetical protein